MDTSTHESLPLSQAGTKMSAGFSPLSRRPATSSLGSENSLKLASVSEAGRLVLDPSFARNLFSFEVEDRRGRMHRFNFETTSLNDLMASVIQKLGGDVDHHNLPQILYEDEDRDKIVLETDEDLASAVDHARLIGLKELKLHLDLSGGYGDHGRPYDPAGLEYAQSASSGSAYLLVAATVAVVAGIGMVAYLKRGGF